ncbi:MAG: beta-lactamase family protein [Peptococcaceae bacterium]|nr:beta-lactamase family protein [Peptococcaceae bacterium]
MLDTKRVTQFEEYVIQSMDEQCAPGLTVAIAKGNKVIYTKAFGYRSKEREITATTETIFGIASITKTITGIAVAQLVEQGLLSFSDPVIKYLPDFRLPGGGGEDVTIHHFLTHTSSMPPLPALGISIRGNTVPDKLVPDKKEITEPAKEQKEEPPVNTYSELIDYIASHECDLLGKTGEYFSYSNDAYALSSTLSSKKANYGLSIRRITA